MNKPVVDQSEKLTITLPNSVIKRIDIERGDVTRSRFFLRLIQGYYTFKEESRRLKIGISRGKGN